ncbi:hypothetical protein CRH09_05740 [Nocardia terpenica]|uniref:Uncharacterized protein n=1 Tax=Nocardia terpenica TaxID=455432 RepID=A0A291RFA8_9NOCA|nr:hypothetical protein CRH09_05740 [Nocardia terpenica]
MKRLGIGLLAIVSTSVLAATAACGSDRPAAVSPDPVVDINQLDIGNYTITPKVFGKPDDIEMARVAEAMRLGDSLPLPMQIDPEAKYAPSALGGMVRTFIDFNTQALAHRTGADLKLLADQTPGLLYGYSTTGRTAETSLATELDNVVMVFDSEQHATTAADTFEKIDLGTKPDNAPVAIGKYPTAHAHASPSEPGLLRSWYSVGRYVIFSYIYDGVMGLVGNTDMPKLVARVEKSIDTITPAVQKFVPTPVDQLLQIDIDPDRMLSRTLSTVNVDNSQSGIPAYYSAHGGLQISSAPDDDTKLFADTGVDRVAWKGGFVYRARDAAAARKLVEIRGRATHRLRRVDPPRNLPFAQCRGLRVPQTVVVNFYCSVSYGRYAATVSANQLADVQQRISAQYALLVNNR